jgi:hypothetical protein
MKLSLYFQQVHGFLRELLDKQAGRGVTAGWT